jgi:hypothetical protein
MWNVNGTRHKVVEHFVSEIYQQWQDFKNVKGIGLKNILSRPVLYFVN